MLFMDISGFTALSERLAKRGRIGAEQVADALNHTFTELLTIAVDLGADPLKFGGDATLQFYEGPGHTQRAARAAALMRSRLRTVGKVDTPQGVLQLRMSQGVHTGKFDFFKVACSHQELIVTGSGASTTVEMEGIANAGEILLSPAAARHLASGLVGDQKESGLLLARTPPRPDTVPAPPARTGYSLEQFTPIGLRPYLVGKSEGEHRRATIAFLKIKGTDDRISAEGADAVAEWLQQIMVTVLTAAEEGGVTFLSTDIDEGAVKVILSAGVPATSGNDDERMLHVLRRIDESPIGKYLAMGVNRGVLFAGDLGAPFRRYYTVIGDGVNLAARVMSQAHLGQVLATPVVLDRSPTIFETEDLEPFMVKGKSQPVRAAVVGKAIGTRDETEGAELPLVGRDTEMAQILEAFRASRTEGSAVELIGPSGSGKSRLFGEAYGATQPTEWLKVSCEEYQRITPYAPIATLLRRILGLEREAGDIGEHLKASTADHAPELAPWLPLLATTVGMKLEETPETAALDARFRKDKTHEVVIDYLTAVRPNHSVLFFDNAQWMDDASGELIERLVQTVPAHPWLVALARRPDEGGFSLPDDGGVRIELGELKHRDLLQLASLATTEHPLPRPRIEEIINRSGGNPLFLLEMLSASAGATDSDELPGSIEELITARIDRLDPELRRLLRYSSALGRHVDVDLLVESVGDDLPEASDPVNWAALSDYLEPSDDATWRFRQNLFRDVAYGSLPFGVRKTLHGRIGTVLEEHSDDPEKDADQLSLHFSIAGEHQRSWKYSRLAGDHARDQYANVEAADFYQRALESAHHLRSIDRLDVASVSESLGDVSELAGLYEPAKASYSGARRGFHDDSTATARIMNKQGLLSEKSGDLSNALRWFRRGLTLLDRSSTRSAAERADLQIAYAGVKFRQGRFQDCVDWCERALADLEGSDAPSQRAHALYMLIGANAQLRRPIDDIAPEAMDIYEEVGDLYGLGALLNNIGIEAFYRGDWNEALEMWERSRQARTDAGDIIGAAASANNIAEIYSDQGRVAEAIDLFREALAVWEGAKFPVGVALVNLNLGRADARAGMSDLAQARLDTAFDMFDEMGAQSYVLDTSVRRAEAFLLSGEFDSATKVAESLLREVTSDEHTLVYEAALHRILGYCCQEQEDQAGSLANFEKALSLAHEADAAFETALVLEGMLRFFGDDGRGTVWQAEEDHLFQRLGIIATPVVPLSSATELQVSPSRLSLVTNVL
jgi:class 3 adenylate cyclase/tetratricopeptide (TPR) repeat protein/energy-coupling factor transporter ATP-binding protein EcfA2